jgi:hypothetical protein
MDNKECCFYCESATRKNCDNLTNPYRESVCQTIEKKREEQPKTTFWLGCPEHGTLATDMLLTDVSVIFDNHREVCGEYLTILPQSAKK